jgi:hypothetical protein
MAGVTIGDGAIIAANTVVKKCRALHNCRGIQRKSLENDFQKTYKVIIRNSMVEWSIEKSLKMCSY